MPPRYSRRTVLAGSTAGAGLLAACFEPTTRGAGRNPERGPELIGHRGCAVDHPENTVAAVEAAAPVVDAVEVDVRRCRGGTLVAFHDETLGRLTDRTGRVWETSCTDLLATEVLDSGETVPALDEVFDAVPDDVGVVLDLKERGVVPDVRSLVGRYRNDVVLSARHTAILEEALSVAPALPRAYIVMESVLNRPLRPVVPEVPLYAPENTDAMVRTALDLGCVAIQPRLELCLKTDLVARAHDAGLRVAAHTVTSRGEFEALAAAGVDAVFTAVCEPFDE